ncbi:MAG: YqzG/YhdC family protein [Bacillales bacterium]
MRKKFFSAFGIVLMFIYFSVPAVLADNEPDYQKYGRIALTMVKEQYPGKDIEYQYLGRRNLDGTKVVDTFRFEVQQSHQQMFVHVRVLHDEKNSNHLSILLEEKRQ